MLSEIHIHSWGKHCFLQCCRFNSYWGWARVRSYFLVCLPFPLWNKRKQVHLFCLEGAWLILLEQIPVAKTRRFTKLSSRVTETFQANDLELNLAKIIKMPPVLDNWRFLQQEHNSRKIKLICWKAPTVRVTQDSKCKKSFLAFLLPSWSW